MAGEALYEALTNLGNLYTQRLREDRIRQQHQEDIQGERDYADKTREEHRKWTVEQDQNRDRLERERALWAKEQERTLEAQRLGLGENASWGEITNARRSQNLGDKDLEAMHSQAVRDEADLKTAVALLPEVERLREDLRTLAAKKGDNQSAQDLNPVLPSAKNAFEAARAATTSPDASVRNAAYEKLAGPSPDTDATGNPRNKMYWMRDNTGKYIPNKAALDGLLKSTDAQTINGWADSVGLSNPNDQIKMAALQQRAIDQMMRSEDGEMKQAALLYHDAAMKLASLQWVPGVSLPNQPKFQSVQKNVEAIRQVNPAVADRLASGLDLYGKVESVLSPKAAPTVETESAPSAAAAVVPPPKTDPLPAPQTGTPAPVVTPPAPSVPFYQSVRNGVAAAMNPDNSILGKALIAGGNVLNSAQEQFAGLIGGDSAYRAAVEQNLYDDGNLARMTKWTYDTPAASSAAAGTPSVKDIQQQGYAAYLQSKLQKEQADAEAIEKYRKWKATQPAQVIPSWARPTP